MSALLLLAAVAQTAAARPPITLHVGDPAPAMTVVKWMKGTPQTDFKDGKVHVVEFWATWCGPCKVGMPHLSALAKRYEGKVAFTGVDGSESKDDIAKSEAFVRQAGPMMAYNVAYATPRGAMTKDWMQAAGQYGIPCSFVVDHQGRIGWIGHPLMGLEQALDLAVADKLTPDAAAEIGKAWDAKLKQGEETGKAEEAAEKDGKVDEALTLNAKLAEEWPFAAPDVAATKYRLLTAKNPSEATAFGKSLLKEDSNAPYVLRAVATEIANETSAVKGERDYRLAKSLLEQSDRCLAPTPSSTGMLAKAEFALGNKETAVKLQESIVNDMTESLKTIDFGTSPNGQRAKEAREKMLAEAQTLLEKYKGNSTVADKPKG